jgi:ABC-2 type transport system permease protein
LKRIYALIWKELLAVLRDKKVRISILLPPIIQLFIFTFAATLDVKNVSMAILNKDNGKEAIELIQRFYGSKIFNTDITFLSGQDEITPYIENQKGLFVLTIDEEFSRNLNASKPGYVQLIFDGRKTNTAQIVAGYIEQIVNRFNNDFLANAKMVVQNADLITRVWYNPNLNYVWYNIPCLTAILAMLSCLVVTTQSVARERELGTFDQLLVSPLMPYEILIGKIVPGVLIGMLEGLMMLFIGVVFLSVPFTGSYFLYGLSLLIFVVSISGIGLFISSISLTQQQAMLGTFVFMMPSVLLSGYATPIENMPNWLQPFTYFIPLKYMLILSKGIFLKGMGLKIVLENILFLFVISIFNLIGSMVFFRRRLF